MMDILLEYILSCEFINNLDAKRDFDENFVTKKKRSSRTILILSML